MRYFTRHKILSIVLILLSVYLYVNYTRIIEVNPKIDKSSPAYVNDIYMSDERIYNNYLNELEKVAYNDLKDMFEKRTTKNKVDLTKYQGKTTSEVRGIFGTAHEALMLDHPEMLQFAGMSYYYSETELEVRIRMAINNPVMESLNTLKIRRIIDNIKKDTKNMTDREKIKYVYDWIGDNNTYDDLFTTQSKNQSIYNVFIKGNAVCAGFAKASQVIFQNIGIESVAISGNSTGPHMWNIVKVDDKYYYYDSTYAASINDKSHPSFYGGLTQEEMNYYTVDYPTWYPKVETTNGLMEVEENET